MLSDYTKLYILLILGVLLKYSDEENPIKTKKEIQEYIKTEYDVTVGYKAIGQNLIALEEFLSEADLGFTLDYHGLATRVIDGEEQELKSDWFLTRDITKGEVQILINSMLYSKYIPLSLCRPLIDKLNKQSGVETKRVFESVTEKTKNTQFLYNIELLSEAIDKGVMVTYKFAEYGTGIDNIPGYIQRKGKPHTYKVSPYEIVINNGKYYLLCSHSKGDEIFSYRIDYIKDLAFMLKDEDGECDESNFVINRPITDLRNHKNGFDLQKYMNEHIYMFNGESVEVTLLAYKTYVDSKGDEIETNIVNYIRDWFGDGVVFRNNTEKTIEANVLVNKNAMLYWTLQYGRLVEVLKPQSLRDSVVEVVGTMYNRYCR